MPSILTFRRGTFADRDEVADWFEGLDARNKAEVKAVLLDLVKSPRARWDRPDYGDLKYMQGFGEIILKLKPSGIQKRLVGYWTPDDHFAVVLLHDKNKSGKIASHEQKIASDRKGMAESTPIRMKVWLDDDTFR